MFPTHNNLLCRLLYVPFGNNVLCVSILFYLCEPIAKQRIDSGFFLFEAEMKKKKEKKQSKKLKASQCRNLKAFMDSSDEDFYWIWFLVFCLECLSFLHLTQWEYVYNSTATQRLVLCTGIIEQGWVITGLRDCSHQ